MLLQQPGDTGLGTTEASRGWQGVTTQKEWQDPESWLLSSESQVIAVPRQFQNLLSFFLTLVPMYD